MKKTEYCKLWVVDGYWNDDPLRQFNGYLMYDGNEYDCPISDDLIFFYGSPYDKGLEFTITSKEPQIYGASVDEGQRAEVDVEQRHWDNVATWNERNSDW